MSEHEGAEVARLVLVGEVVLPDARLRVVLDGAQVFSVGRVLPLARHPHHVAHHGAPHLLLLLDVVDQVLRRGLARRLTAVGPVRQLRPLLEGLRLPVVDLKRDCTVISFCMLATRSKVVLIKPPYGLPVSATDLARYRADERFTFCTSDFQLEVPGFDSL